MGSSLLEDTEDTEEKEVRSNVNSEKLTQELIDEMLAEDTQAYLQEDEEEREFQENEFQRQKLEQELIENDIKNNRLK